MGAEENLGPEATARVVMIGEVESEVEAEAEEQEIVEVSP